MYMYIINSLKDILNHKKFYLCIICLNQQKPNIHLVQSFCSSFYAMLIKTIECTATFKDSAKEKKNFFGIQTSYTQQSGLFI